MLVSAAASPALLAVVLGRCAPASSPWSSTPGCRRPSGPRSPRTPTRPSTSATTPASCSGDDEAELADVPLARPMHYTSGTTGRRKGVWSGVLADDDARRLAAEEIELWGFEPADRHLVLSPLHHSAPLRFAIHTLLAGGEVLLPGPFDAARAAAAIADPPPDDDVLRAHPPAAAARPRRTSTGPPSAGSCTPGRPARRR